jgi:hypothetical protein
MTGSAIGAVNNSYLTYGLILFLAFFMPMMISLIRRLVTIYR